ncbi:MAG: alkaline phosphatase [Bacteroidota bacterium]|nr:alkaline phosphatase [Bacteroidota bacterium]
MRNKLRIAFLAIAAIFLLSCQLQQNKQKANSGNLSADEETNSPTPKNIIFMIGDGMGTSHVFAALTAQKGKLEMARCKHIGFCKTQSANNYITDSAAGVSAFATGKKTNNGVLNISPQGDTLKTVLEIAEENGLSTGLIATSTIAHATPAGFVAHNINRNNYEEIALDYLKTEVDIFIGGGRDHFENRKDGQNLSEQLRSRGYDVVYSLKDVLSSNQNKIAGMLYKSDPPKMSEGRGQMLEKSSMKAIEILNKNDKGFFLMIEGSQIDWAGHEKDSEYLVSEAVDFDIVIGKVLDFAEQDGETLVVITADHECGGYAIVGGNIESGEVVGDFCLGDHTATMVPVFAFGPGAEQFMGIINNTDLFHNFIELYGF